jgi:hypothetical protein
MIGVSILNRDVAGVDGYTGAGGKLKNIGGEVCSNIDK